jgi:hypothetical protein
MTDGVPERDIVASVARTALRTKLHTVLADQVRALRRAAARVALQLACSLPPRARTSPAPAAALLTYRRAPLPRRAADGHRG